MRATSFRTWANTSLRATGSASFLKNRSKRRPGAASPPRSKAISSSTTPASNTMMLHHRSHPRCLLLDQSGPNRRHHGQNRKWQVDPLAPFDPAL
jgi:hypothetical protein